MIAWFATKGSGTNEALRIARLVEGVGPLEELAFDKKRKFRSFVQVLSGLRLRRPELIVMEGTGIAGGLACVLARLFLRIPYVLSSGDAVGPFVASHRPGLGWVFTIYEWILCRLAAGFIGWTPYLVGRALTFGARRAVTAAGWAWTALPADGIESLRAETRRRLGIPGKAIVFGIAGALEWNGAKKYCYGWELVQAMGMVTRPDIHVLIVGGGSGVEHLRRVATGILGGRVHFAGTVPMEEVAGYLCAMDVGSLPQTLDGVGLFRYTTKISEYIQARLPIVTSRVPMAYDLDDGFVWRLPGSSPAGAEYLSALAALMQNISKESIAEKRAEIPCQLEIFNPEKQHRRVNAFLLDILAENGATHHETKNP